MADDQPAACDPRLVERKVSDLALHLEHVAACDLEVLALAQVASRPLAADKLEGGHVHTHDSVNQPKAVRTVVGARFLDDRQPQSTPDREWQRLQDLRHHVLRRDPVDVMAAYLLPPQHQRTEPLGRRPPTLDLPGDAVVLAKDAAQVAAGEEDRARTVPAAQAVLFAEVRKMGGNDRVAADPAESAARPRGGPRNTAWDKLCTAHPTTGAHTPLAPQARQSGKGQHRRTRRRSSRPGSTLAPVLAGESIPGTALPLGAQAGSAHRLRPRARPGRTEQCIGVSNRRLELARPECEVAAPFVGVSTGNPLRASGPPGA